MFLLAIVACCCVCQWRRATDGAEGREFVLCLGWFSEFLCRELFLCTGAFEQWLSLRGALWCSRCTSGAPVFWCGFGSGARIMGICFMWLFLCHYLVTGVRKF